MSRLAILFSGLFALLVFLPSTSGTARFGPFKTPLEELEDPTVSVQWEEPRQAIDEEEVRPEQGMESAWVVSGSSDSIPLLIRYLRSQEEIVQLAALAEFVGMAARAKAAVPAILDALNDPKSSIRVEAAATLIHMNVQSRAAVGALRKELKAKEATARAHAAWTIGQLIKPPALATSCWGPDPPPPVARPWVGQRTLPALVEALADRQPKVRAQAAQTLGFLGPGAKPAAPALARALKDEAAAVREAAEQSLQKIDRREAHKAGIK